MSKHFLKFSLSLSHPHTQTYNTHIDVASVNMNTNKSIKQQHDNEKRIYYNNFTIKDHRSQKDLLQRWSLMIFAAADYSSAPTHASSSKPAFSLCISSHSAESTLTSNPPLNYSNLVQLFTRAII